MLKSLSLIVWPSSAGFGISIARTSTKPRWTAYDAKYFGVEMEENVPMTTQDRAYTSLIWYTP